MANPYDKKYTVTEEDGRVEYPANSCNYFMPGDVITMTETEYNCFRDTVMPAASPGRCGPRYCPDGDAWSTQGHRNTVLIPAGSTVETAVASVEGCLPFDIVCFHYCSSCLYVGYDAEPVIDEVSDGTAADPNPTCRDLIENGECVESLFIHNPSDSDVLVTLSYYYK